VNTTDEKGNAHAKNGSRNERFSERKPRKLTKQHARLFAASLCKKKLDEDLHFNVEMPTNTKEEETKKTT
jgi:hypothetical protein